MARGHSLAGLMKWLRREEWRQPFEEVLERHLGPACSKADIAVEDLPSLIDEHGFMTLWGCAFEDFLSRDLDDGRNMVDDYLKRRGWKESTSTRAYMAALRNSVMSLYEVSDIVAGESFLARDLVRGGDPVRVTERTATRSLKQWDRIGARVVHVGRQTNIGGGLLLFDRDASDTILDMIRRVTTKTLEKTAKLVRTRELELDEAEFAAAVDASAVLRYAAPTFSTVWLDDLLGEILTPTVPELRNSDGDEILWSTVHYRLQPGTTGGDIRSALSTVPTLRQETDTFWNWVEEAKPSSRKARGGQDRTGRAFVTMMDDGAVVLGNVELDGTALRLSVNSSRRAERGQALLDPVLGGLVEPALVETQTIEQMLASPSRGHSQAPSGHTPAQERQIVHEYLDEHYSRMLDESIPMLGDVTPLKAAKTATGREKLVDWLKLLENHSARQAAGTALAEYDFGWLWRKLGVAELRR